MDSARTALRLGAREVTVFYRRSRVEMPASREEIERALEEGVEILFLTAPRRIGRRDGGLRVYCQRMKLGEPDASGRPRPIPIEGSEFFLDLDQLIVAVGQQPEVPERFGLTPGRAGVIPVESATLATTKKGVFAGGDVVTGPASVIEAVAAGRRAASSIDKYLGGEGNIEEALVEVEEPSPWLGRDGDFAHRGRVPMPLLAVDLRLERFARRSASERGWLLAEQGEFLPEENPWRLPHSSFPEVELGFNREQAVEEARRCLKCHLRLRIASAPLPPANGG